MKELDKRFDFKTIDAKWAGYWVDENVFHATPDKKKKPYTIVIPPPNVTGILHMGHALNNTLQDIIIRYKRMNGFSACWMPGTDHAGIATQNVVEKQLAKEGTKRQDLGREKFNERLWDWKKQYGDTIIDQLKAIGASCDWPRARFTMDDDYSFAVRKVFVELYKKDLIYKGEFIINWCPRCHTALSDEEAEHQDTQGNLYYIKYPFKDNPQEAITVATTRPETMLGDTAVAVNPGDKRFKKLIGKKLILPIVNREISVIADAHVEASFGTGAVKVTPAHDPNDFNIGKRHNLEFINVMNPDATMNEHAGRFAGQDRFKAREGIIETLRQSGLLVKIEPHQHAVGHCYRCHTVVEPYLSKQWFVKMKPLAKPALEVVKKGKVKFYPDRWTKVYVNWLTDIRDWCISRQIWWGHRIPVWYCLDNKSKKCAEPIVALEDPKQCPHCRSTNLKQDEDVLDTWFSSWLWPFATFGWPKKNEDLKYFYPGHALFTASEIIFFWVARMIMAGLEFMDNVPFSDVYIHGTVRDAQGRKMSKSLGNAIDPLEIVNEYGADALRFSLIMNSGQDLFISKDKFEIGRNFANKIWNASRLLLMNAKDEDLSADISEFADAKKLDLPSRWIIARFYETLAKVSESIERFRYSEAENLIYDYFWNSFCDWHLEIIKNKFSEAPVRRLSIALLKESLKMMHPFIPFVTEELWQVLAEKKGPLCLTPWPSANKKFAQDESLTSMQELFDLISAVRNVRAQWQIKPGDLVACYIACNRKETLAFIEQHKDLIASLAKTKQAQLYAKLPQEKNMAKGIAGTLSFAIPLGELIDIEQEKNRIAKEIQAQEASIQSLAQRLGNKEFMKKAPKEIVAKEEERLKSLKSKTDELKSIIKSLN